MGPTRSKRTRSTLLKYYRTEDAPSKGAAELTKSLEEASVTVKSLREEVCFNVQLADDAPALSKADCNRLLWLLAETFEPEKTSTTSFLPMGATVLEVGPRLSFATAFSSNAVSICAACGLSQVVRVECSRRFLVDTSPKLSIAQLSANHAKAVHDPMTECVYTEPLASFDTSSATAATGVRTIAVCSEGRAALERASIEMDLGFDEADVSAALQREHHLLHYTLLLSFFHTLQRERHHTSHLHYTLLSFPLLSHATHPPFSLSLSLADRPLHQAIRRALGPRPDRCRVLRHGPVELGALPPLVLWRRDRGRRRRQADVALQDGQGDAQVARVHR